MKDSSEKNVGFYDCSQKENLVLPRNIHLLLYTRILPYVFICAKDILLDNFHVMSLPINLKEKSIEIFCIGFMPTQKKKIYLEHERF